MARHGSPEKDTGRNPLKIEPRQAPESASWNGEWKGSGHGADRHRVPRLDKKTFSSHFRDVQTKIQDFQDTHFPAPDSHMYDEIQMHGVAQDETNRSRTTWQRWFRQYPASSIFFVDMTTTVVAFNSANVMRASVQPGSHSFLLPRNVAAPEPWMCVVAIVSYGAAVGLRYYIHSDEKHQDMVLVSCCVAGVLLGIFFQFSPLEILFGILPKLVLAGLVVSSLIFAAFDHRRRSREDLE